MRELIKKDQIVDIIPQDFKNSNKGKVLNVDMDGFTMQLKYTPKGLIQNHICDFYSLTDNGYLYFESYIKDLNNNIISIANPIKHRFLQRRKFTRITFLSDIELKSGDKVHKARTLDISAGAMKLSTKENINIEDEYDVTLQLEKDLSVSCKYKLIRVEKNDAGIYTISGRFTCLSNIDKMTLVQFCMKKNMENINK